MLVSKMFNSGFSLSEKKIISLSKAMMQVNITSKSKYLTCRNEAMFKDALPYLTGYADHSLAKIASAYNITFDELIAICKYFYKVYNPYALEVDMLIYDIYLPNPYMYTKLPRASVLEYRHIYSSNGNFSSIGSVDNELNAVLCNIFSKPKLDKVPTDVSYAIYCTLNKKFFTGNDWVSDISNAKIFKSKASAQHYLKDLIADIIPVRL